MRSAAIICAMLASRAGRPLPSNVSKFQQFDNGVRAEGSVDNHGTTRRRHVRVIGHEYIGKEADKWEEQMILGTDGGAEYGSVGLVDPEALRNAAIQLTVRELSQRSGLSIGLISEFRQGKRDLTSGQAVNLRRAVNGRNR